VKLYTKTGDDGTTGLFGGGRVPKASARVAAYGTVDELNATLGVARAHGFPPALDALVASIQGDLFVLGAELACVPGKEEKMKMRLLDDADIARLEAAIDASEAALPGLTTFVLPGGCREAAALHFSRTVCRRAEREVLAAGEPRPALVMYLNRLSDLLFSLARGENVRRGVADVPWLPRA